VPPPVTLVALATHVALPWRDARNPLARSSSNAATTVERLTPTVEATERSGGSTTFA
jgi:hypothetical protein